MDTGVTVIEMGWSFGCIEVGRVVGRGHGNSGTGATNLKFQSWLCHLLPVRLWAAHFTSLSLNSYSVKLVNSHHPEIL